MLLSPAMMLCVQLIAILAAVAANEIARIDISRKLLRELQVRADSSGPGPRAASPELDRPVPATAPEREPALGAGVARSMIVPELRSGA